MIVDTASTLSHLGGALGWAMEGCIEMDVYHGASCEVFRNASS